MVNFEANSYHIKHTFIHFVVVDNEFFNRCFLSSVHLIPPAAVVPQHFVKTKYSVGMTVLPYCYKIHKGIMLNLLRRCSAK